MTETDNKSVALPMTVYALTVVVLSLTLTLFYRVPTASALPAFSRQTGQECAACHVGSFGPQLTPFGRSFKLSGYTLGNKIDAVKKMSAMVVAGFEHTNGDLRKGTELTDHLQRLKTNDNVTVDQASLFYGGSITPKIGMMAQLTWSPSEETLGWDNADLRYADNATVYGKNLVYGVTANNNPGVQDLWQTTPAWRFPYLQSALAPTPAAGPYLAGLGQTVGGLGVYGMWNDLLYAELSGYGTLTDRTQMTLGVQDAKVSDHLSGINPYWRVALQHDTGQHYVELGTYGMSSERYPGNDHSSGTDRMLDYALDGTYQFTSVDTKHRFSLYASALRERQDLNATFALLDSSNPTNSLTDFETNASYYYDNTYGITVGRFGITGSADAILYPGPAGNKPDSAGWTVQLDATPFGKQGSPGYPFLNMRLFAQYTMYDKFDGAKTNYDGLGRNASDNNTFFAGTWFAF